MRRHAHKEGDERNHGDGRDAEHDLQRLASAKKVDAHEHDKEEGDDGLSGDARQQVQRLHVGGDESGDRRRADGVFDQDGEARQRAADLAHGTTGKPVAGSRRGHGRGHLSQAEHHEQVHRAHHDEGDDHSEPAAIGDAEVPTREVAGDDVGNAQTHEQNPAHRALFQGAPFEIFPRFGFDAVQHGDIRWRRHEILTLFSSFGLRLQTYGPEAALSAPSRETVRL